MAIYLGSNQVDLGLYNIQSDWEETDTTKESYIQNKPIGVSAFTNDAGYQTATQVASMVASEVEKLKVVVIDVPSFSSLPQTVTNASISEDHVCIKAELGTPSAQTGDWTVTTADGSLTLSGSISGSTTAKLYLAIQE